MVQNVGVTQTVVGHFNALEGGKPHPHGFLDHMLEGGVAVVSQFQGEADDGGFRYAHLTAQAGGGHISGFVVVVPDIVCNQFLSFGEGWACCFKNSQ